MIAIGTRRVGRGEPCYVIAEAGVNHDGDLDRAVALVHAAAKTGADAVKFQLFRAGDVATAGAAKAGYQRVTTDPEEAQIDMLRGLELPDEAFATLAREAAHAGIDFLCTPYSERDADVLAALGVPALKVASALIVEPRFLAHLARLGKPLIVSTGMATLDEVADAIATIGSAPVVLLQCTTEYPAAPQDANLSAMASLEEAFAVPVGFSDHTEGPDVALAAVALGACVLEKHFTLDRSLPGPDHRASLEPGELADLVQSIRTVEAALGSPRKEPTPTELANRAHMRRSLVAAVDIAAGTTITGVHVTAKRPGDGMAPKLFDHVVGATARVDIARDTVLSPDMLE